MILAFVKHKAGFIQLYYTEYLIAETISTFLLSLHSISKCSENIFCLYISETYADK